MPVTVSVDKLNFDVFKPGEKLIETVISEKGVFDDDVNVKREFERCQCLLHCLAEWHISLQQLVDPTCGKTAVFKAIDNLERLKQTMITDQKTSELVGDPSVCILAMQACKYLICPAS